MDFSDISSYSDKQVAHKIQELEDDVNFHQYISNLIFPVASKFFSKFINKHVKKKFNQQFSSCDSIEMFQNAMAPLVSKMIENTTDGFTYSGLENLSDKPTLFIGNHRDISLDAALLALNLYQSGFKTFNIAVGNNLMEETWASDLFRLNKSFIIQRSGGTKKEIYSGLSLASQFIHQSIFQDNDSVWIAQKQGRAKDGIDETDPALLKMIHLTQRKSKSAADYFNSLKVVPVSISYEYDPNDQLKAKELYSSQSNSSYVKEKDEDLRSIANGITGFKGNVNINLSEPMKFDEDDDYQAIAEKITHSIVAKYELHPTNYAACNLMNMNFQDKGQYTQKEIKYAKGMLEERLQTLRNGARTKLLEQYANPVIRKLRLS